MVYLFTLICTLPIDEVCAKVIFGVRKPSQFSFGEVVMEQLYTCNDRICHDNQHLYDVGEVIEHLRTKQKLSFSRPRELEISDSHRHV